MVRTERAKNLESTSLRSWHIVSRFSILATCSSVFKVDIIEFDSHASRKFKKWLLQAPKVRWNHEKHIITYILKISKYIFVELIERNVKVPSWEFEIISNIKK